MYTYKRIYSQIWDKLPIDHKLISEVDELDTNKDQISIDNRHHLFEWSPGHEIIDEEILVPDNNQILYYEDE